MTDFLLDEGRRGQQRLVDRQSYGYPPDLQDEAVKTVLAQAELLCADWASENAASA